MSSDDAGLAIRLEFGGGAELLFDRKKRHDVILPGGEEWTLKKLLHWIRDNLLTEREELFLQDDTVRPGILVLVNDADWELLANYPFEFKRIQFPLHSCFAMGFNKSQRQSLKMAGIDVREDCFSHGPFYVACSRVSSASNLVILAPKGNITNVVYKEVLGLADQGQGDYRLCPGDTVLFISTLHGG